MKDKEYELLRNEILNRFNQISQTTSILYTATTALLTYALSKNEFYFCLIPCIIIVSLHLLNQRKQRGICKISAYMIVFLEGKDFNWETRQNAFEMTKGRPSKSNKLRGSLTPYYYLALLCSLLSIIKILIGTSSEIEKIICIAFVLIWTLIIMTIMIVYAVDYDATRVLYINKWKDIKKDEERKKDLATNIKH